MKKNNLMKVVFALFIGISITMTSCKKDEPSAEPNQHNDAFGDVFVKKVNTPNGVKYGLVFYAGGQGLTACKAKAPDGTEYTLAEYWKGPGNMRLHPAPSDMQVTMPQTGDYTFTMTFDDGETKNITDALSSVEIPAFMQATVAHTQGTEDVNINWGTVNGADNYMIKLTDEHKNEQKPIFVNKGILPTETTYSFNRSTTATPGWMQPNKPVAGDTCYIMVVAVKYEDGVSGAAKDQNIQMVTAKPARITW